MADFDNQNADCNAEASMSLTLLVRLRARDPLAWERLCTIFGPTVYGWCQASGLRDEDAADVFQEVFQSVARAIDSFRRDRPGDSFTAWLATITRNKVRDFYRRQTKTPNAEGGSAFYKQLKNIPDPLTDESSISSSEADVLHRVLELIRGNYEERTWKAFELTAIQQKEPIDVAAELGLSVNSVYNAKSRILKRLRDELNGLVDA